MEELIRPVAQLLAEVIVPSLQSVQASQAEQIAANARLQRSIDEMRLSMEAQFAHLSAQLTACRAELAATLAVLQAAQALRTAQPADRAALVH